MEIGTILDGGVRCVRLNLQAHSKRIAQMKIFNYVEKYSEATVGVENVQM